MPGEFASGLLSSSALTIDQRGKLEAGSWTHD